MIWCQLPTIIQNNSDGCLTSCCFVGSRSCDCTEWNFFNQMPFRCPLIFHTCDSLPPPAPSVLPIQTHVEGSHAEMVTKDHRASPPPPVHLHVLSQLLHTLKLSTVRVTSILIQLSSGLEINWLLKQTDLRDAAAEHENSLILSSTTKLSVSNHSDESDDDMKHFPWGTEAFK